MLIPKTASHTLSVREQTVLTRMHRLQALGLGPEAIAAQLNSEGLRTPNGTRWRAHAVHDILLQLARYAAQQIAADAELLWQALCKLEPLGSAPISVCELRPAMPQLAHDDFDRAALHLRNQQCVFLNRHDFPHSLPEQIRQQLLREGDHYYVAISIRADENGRFPHWPPRSANGA